MAVTKGKPYTKHAQTQDGRTSPHVNDGVPRSANVPTPGQEWVENPAAGQFTEHSYMADHPCGPTSTCPAQ